MALSARLSNKTTLDRFLRWAEAQGIRVGENPRFGTKKVYPVHMAGSWHYSGEAADLNYGVNGPAEKAVLIRAMKKAQSMGLSVIYAANGTIGEAAGHQNHLHVDIGSWSNTGRGLYRTPIVNPPKRFAVVGIYNKAVRQEWQRQLGVDTDGVFGNGSVKALQRFLNNRDGKRGFELQSKLKEDGVDGTRTWKAVQKFLNAEGKRGAFVLKKPLKVTGKRDARTIMALRKSLNADLW